MMYYWELELFNGDRIEFYVYDQNPLLDKGFMKYADYGDCLLLDIEDDVAKKYGWKYHQGYYLVPKDAIKDIVRGRESNPESINMMYIEDVLGI